MLLGRVRVHMNGVTCGGRHMCWVKMPRVYTIMGKQAEQNLLLFCLGHRLNRAATNHTGICEAGGAWIISVRWQKPAAAIDLKRRAVIPPNHIMLAPLPGTMEKERQPASLQRKGKIDRQQVWIRAVIQCKAQDFSLSQYRIAAISAWSVTSRSFRRMAKPFSSGAAAPLHPTPHASARSITAEPL